MAFSKRDKQFLGEDEDELVVNDELDIELQPHLSQHHTTPRPSHSSPAESYAYVGPAGQNDVSASSSQRVALPDVTFASLQSQSDAVASGNAVNGLTSQALTPSTDGTAAEGSGVTRPDQSAMAARTPPNPVYYEGQSVVMQAPVVTTRPDGTRSIQTHHIAGQWREHHRPLRQRKIKILKIVSVVALIVFFPTGIPAVYCAWRTEREFEEGIMGGSIDRALKFARRTEHLIIISFVLVIAVVILSFALVEKQLTENNTYVNRGIITG